MLNWLRDCGGTDSVSCQLHLSSDETGDCCQPSINTAEEDEEEIQEMMESLAEVIGYQK